MTDYHYVAERAFHQTRQPGSRFWMECSPEERDFFAAFVRAVEEGYSTPPDAWCPGCDDLRDEVSDLEDAHADLHERIVRIRRLTE